MKKFAILLIGYNKTETFRKTVQSLAGSMSKYDIFVKLDNCGDEKITEELKNIVLEHFPEADITIRPKQFKLDFNVICSMNEVFQKGYDGIFYTEDDVIYDSTAMKTLENLLEWTEKNIPGKIGAVQSWNYNISDPEMSEYYYNDIHGLKDLKYEMSFVENEIGYTGQNYWGALITKECWMKIGPDILKIYADLIIKKSVNINFIKDIMKKAEQSEASDAVKKRIISRYSYISWEANMDLIMLANNLYKICLTNPRSKTIGETGSTSTNSMFIRCGLDRIKTLDSPEIPNEFILNKESEQKWFK